MACIWTLWVCINPASAREQTYRRWAIVASEAVEDGGLPDLLIAELSKREDLEWVERRELKAIIAEQELATCFGAQAVAERIKLGKLVGADVLVLLSLEEREKVPLEAGTRPPKEEGEKETFLKLTISDCRCGARLWLEFVPYGADRLEPLCQACATAVDQTRRRFAEGIRQVIAVTPFLSKNLVHDYDHLQAGYAYLLQSALMSYPGVAVVETEEARAIRREFQIAGKGLEERIVPFSVEAEYEVTVEAPEVEPAVRLALRVSDAKRIRLEFRREGLPLSEIPELLRGPVPQQIVELSQQRVQTALTREQQYALLTKRAEVFSRLGVYEHSTGLREAALLLKSDDVDQRLAAIGDYLRLHHLYSQGLSEFFPHYGSDARPESRTAPENPFLLARLLTFRIVSRHIEEVIRSRALNPFEAGYLVDHVSLKLLRVGYVSQFRRVEELKEAADEFFWLVYPLFPTLDYGLRDGRVTPAVCHALGIPANIEPKPRSPIWQYMEWTSRGMRFLCHDWPRIGWRYGRGKPDDRRTLENLYRFLTEVATRSVPLPYVMSLVTREPPWDLNSMIKKGRLEVDEVRRFYERLKETVQPVNVLYGRVGLLALRVYTTEEELGPEAIEEVDRLAQLASEMGAARPDDERAFLYSNLRIDRLRSDIAKRLGRPPQEKRHQLPRNPIPDINARFRVAFEPIEGIKSDWLGLCRCTDSLDVAWSRRAVCVIPEKGAVRQVFPLDQGTSVDAPKVRVYGAHWDGENIWVACAVRGIYVVSPDGEVVGCIGTEQGLPPRDNRSFYRVGPHMPPLMLHPIEPGRCIAVGRFGKHRRLWIAEVARRQGAPDGSSFVVKVFHTATKTPETPGTEPENDPHVIFQPAWMLEYSHLAEPRQRWLLVGRQVRGGAVFTKGRRPLAVDLETLRVSLFPARVHLAGYNWNPRYAIDGQIVCAAGIRIELLSPPEAGIEGDWRRRSLVEFEPFRRSKLRPVLLECEGMLYNPGAQWRRIDPATWNIEHLKSPTMPYQDPFQCYGVSAHYGMVGWNVDEKLYRISIEPRPEPDDLAALYPCVPQPRRAEHHEAVEAIRSLGGSVDTRWGFCHHTFRWPETFIRRPPDLDVETFEWRTIAYLGESWKGGDAGLKHLQRLYDLRDLYLVEANITNEGLEAIGRIDTLQSLYVVETRATDRGLPYLQGLDNLVYLRLEGTAGGGQLTDAGLKHLRELLRLEKVTLYGDRFTDQGLLSLQSLPKLRELWLLNTAITKAGLSKLAASREGLRYFQDKHQWYYFFD